MGSTSGPLLLTTQNEGAESQTSPLSRTAPLPMPAGSLVTASTDAFDQDLIEMCTKLSSQYHMSEYNISKRRNFAPQGTRSPSGFHTPGSVSGANTPRRSPSPATTPSPIAYKRSPSHPLQQSQRGSTHKPLSSLNHAKSQPALSASAANNSSSPLESRNDNFRNHLKASPNQKIEVDENNQVRRKSRSPSRPASPLKDDSGDLLMRNASPERAISSAPTYINPSNSGRTSPVRAPAGSHHALFSAVLRHPVATNAEERTTAVPQSGTLLDPVETPLTPLRGSTFPQVLRRAMSSTPDSQLNVTQTLAIPRSESSISLPTSPRSLSRNDLHKEPVPAHLIKTSATNPLNISPMVPPKHMHIVADAVFARPKQEEPLLSMPVWFLDQPEAKRLPADALLEAAIFTQTPDQGSTRLGNLFLSSCPGKKVRLTGPIVDGGRSAIKRDLRMDLERIASDDFGIKAIVCCLDDHELAFLGVEWSEYQAIARDIDLEVIRMPISEGYAPASVQELDGLLATLIEAYTVSGHGVLIHCRGGVGRAGLIAVSWALKIGLLGDLTSTPVEEMVHKAVHWIRRRRSTKAIETPVQVLFLHSYITFLATLGEPVSGSDLLL